MDTRRDDIVSGVPATPRKRSSVVSRGSFICQVASTISAFIKVCSEYLSPLGVGKSFGELCRHRLASVVMVVGYCLCFLWVINFPEFLSVPLFGFIVLIPPANPGVYLVFMCAVVLSGIGVHSFFVSRVVNFRCSRPFGLRASFAFPLFFSEILLSKSFFKPFVVGALVCGVPIQLLRRPMAHSNILP